MWWQRPLPPSVHVMHTQLRYWSYCCSVEGEGGRARVTFVLWATADKGEKGIISICKREPRIQKLLHLQFKTRLHLATLAKRLVLKDVISAVGGYYCSFYWEILIDKLAISWAGHHRYSCVLRHPRTGCHKNILLKTSKQMKSEQPRGTGLTTVWGAAGYRRNELEARSWKNRRKRWHVFYWTTSRVGPRQSRRPRQEAPEPDIFKTSSS